MAAGNTLTVTLVAGTTWATTDTVSAAKLNLGDSGMTVAVSGTTRLLTDVAATVPTEGQVLVYRAAAGGYTPEVFPVSSSDTFNRVFAWAHYR